MEQVLAACRAALAKSGRIVALTGAGVSAESGIPTFRGKEGYWTIGAREYHPQELATHEAFEQMPWDVWAWYLYRRGVCMAAAPNAGHIALVEMARTLGDRFALVTQNVDGLHRRAGSPDATTFPIHGDISLMRCANDCVLDRWPIPDAIPALARGEAVSVEVKGLLVCPRCRGMARPHVLWFDESYDEEHFRYESSMAAVERTDLLLVVGTSGATSLPHRLVVSCLRRGTAVVVLNLEESPFSALAAREENGFFWQGSAKGAVPLITQILMARP